jgi:hypothetical protein
MTEMKLSKVFKKDIEKYLGIIPDRRRKDFKQYIAENGGYENAIKTLKSRLNKQTEFKAKKEVRQKQVKTQKEYVERKKEIRPKTDVKRKGRKSKKSIEAATKIQRFYTIQKQINRERTKLFSLEPSKIWNTKYSYNLHNGLPSSIIRIDEKSGETLLLIKDDMVEVFQYYKIDKYLIQKLKEQKQSYKINLGYSITAKDLLTGKYNEIKSILKSYTIYGKSDIYKYFEEVYDEFSYYCDIYNKGVVTINNIYIDIYKVKPLNGSSYIPLPEYIANKKAVINIKNDDNNCFIYSVLCGYLDICDKPHPERVNHYTNHLKLFKYEEKDMPMKIDKIMHFEKRNQLRINVFGIEENSIYPLYVSSNRSNEEFKLINLLFIGDRNGNNHFTYIKNFNRLMKIDDGNNRTNYVCQYCCQFTTVSKEGLEKHSKYCVAGQAVEMPCENSNIKFKNFKNINECPVRIYADFESLKDVSLQFKSKNEKTNFTDGHIGASFKILVVSDIPISLPNKQVDNYYTYQSIYKGLDANDEFVKQIQMIENILIQDMKAAQEQNKDFRTMIITPEQLEQHKAIDECWICKTQFNFKNFKVKHHNHFTGKYHSSICSNCNIQIKDSIKIPVFFHNLNYDKNIFFKSLYNYENIEQINILPDNEESYKCFTIGRLHFLDSFKFMSSSLDNLIKNIPDDNKLFLKSLAADDTQFQLMNKKGYFPYEWFDSIDKLKLPITELKKEDFNNRLKLEALSDNEWDYIQQLIKDLNITTFEEYHDFYLNVDVNGLADVFENFRKTSIDTYKLDPCHYVGTPSFGWDAMLLKTKVELDLMTDCDMYQFFERGIRGGQSVIFKKYAKANNKYLSDYNPDEKSTYISYLDANNLYGVSMSCKLPYGDFEWVKGEDLSINDIMKYNEETDDIAYVLEVDLEYPDELHELHNDYPLACERYQPKGDNCYKLCGTFHDKKDYIVHIKNLQLYLKLGLRLKRINRAVKFSQSSWLKEWIDLNTNFRKVAKNDFEKDYFKLMNNAVFGKTMENVRDRIEIKTAFDPKYLQKYVSKPNFHSSKVLVDDKMVLMKLNKKTVQLNKPIYAGFSILELSKYHMYDFHYNTMKPRYNENIELLMTDTDSLVYEIRTEDFYKDMYEMKQHFDMSEYSKSNPIYDETNKKVIGKFKDETGDKVIKTFVGVRSKVYAIETEDPINKKLNESKKLKGIPKMIVKKQMTLNDYRECVLENKDKIIDGIVGFRTKDLMNYTTIQSKVGLRNTDTKRVWDGINSKAYGHYQL